MSFFYEDYDKLFSLENLKRIGTGATEIISNIVQYVDEKIPIDLGVEQQIFDDQGIVPVQQNAPSDDENAGNINQLEEITQHASKLNQAIIQYQDTDPYANFSYSSYTIPDEPTEQQEARERKEQAESNFIKAALKPFENAAEKINDLGYRFSPNSTATNDIEELTQEDINNCYYIDKDEFGVSRRYHALYGIHPDDEQGYLELLDYYSAFSNLEKELNDAVDTAKSILNNPVLENPMVSLGGTAISTVMILQNSLDPFGVKGAGKAALKGPSNAVTNGSYKSLPDNAKDTYGKYNKDGWNGRVPGQTEGTKAGGTYKNRDGKLPTTDQSGNPITYREYDVNNKVAGQTRDAERFVRGSDGSVYYTNDHYGTFTKVN